MTKNVFKLFSMLALLISLTIPANAKEITVRGTLRKTVESGGWLISAGKSKYLLLNARNFQSESWFKEGTEVEAVGETKPDVMTIYMEGTPFEARTLHAVEQGQAGSANTATRQISRVMVSGDSVVNAQPDTAIVTVSVVTQARSALQAQQENATKSDAVVRALKTAAGTGAEVKTSGYSLQPQRMYKENQPPTITGYEARNSVTVTLSDLSKVGPVIDASSQVGANEFAGIAFTLRQDRQAREDALSQATREAFNKAQVVARALGGRVVRVVEVQEEGTVRPVPVYDAVTRGRAEMAASTPIEVGTLEITSRVQLIAEIEVG